MDSWEKFDEFVAKDLAEQESTLKQGVKLSLGKEGTKEVDQKEIIKE